MRSVLIVDDDKSIAEQLKAEIDWSSLGYERVDCAGDGAAALDFLKGHTVELVISDIVMPGMNGLELLRKINEEHISDACFVILTAQESFNYAQQALRYNCREYLLKPVDAAQITDTIRRLEREGFIVPRKEASESDEGGKVLYKDEIDALISAIDLNDENAIESCADELCNHMTGMGKDRSIAELNLNYYKVKLLHLPDNDEISEEALEGFARLTDIVLKGDPGRHREELKRLVLMSAERLSEMRRSASTGILSEIEKEIKANYGDNLTLRDLADKYYVNSSYLGRLFKKQYDCSFKEYLCSVRIEEAAALLRETDDDVTVIAERVGYNNTGWFTQKFIEIMGCTPAKYRNSAQE